MVFSTTSCMICMFLVLAPRHIVDSTTTVTGSTLYLSTSSWYPTSTFQSSSTGNILSVTGILTGKFTTSSPTTVNTSDDGNSTRTRPTPTPITTTTATTTMIVTFCQNGTCSGNESRCLNESIKDTCMLTDSNYCYQIVYENGTDTYYYVGCSTNCEFLVEETESVTKTTRCCTTDMCNSELLSDPDEENDAIQLSVHCLSVLLSIFVCIIMSN